VIVGRANALTALGLLVLLLVVVLTAPRWTKLLTRTVPGEETGEEGSAAPAAAGEAESSAAAQQKITVKLFFLAPDQPALLIEDREVAYSADLARQIRSVVEEIVKGPQKGLAATLPAETRVIDSFVTKEGIAYVDLSKEAAAKHGGGSRGELLSVYSVVNSIAANFPAVKRVQILVEDRQVATLAGHVDLTRPLTPDMTFLATGPAVSTATVPPAAAATATPGAR
jgi:spore germination protein GerM